MWGGVLADAVDRRRLLVGTQIAQGLLSFGLAGVALASHPSHTAIVALVLAIGIAIGGVIYASFEAGPVFAVNACTYVFAVIGLLWARYARHADAGIEERGALGCSHRSQRAIAQAPAADVGVVLVLLRDVRRDHAADRQARLRHQPEERRLRLAVCVVRGWRGARCHDSRSPRCSRCSP
jgi:hypothetical protein